MAQGRPSVDPLLNLRAATSHRSDERAENNWSMCVLSAGAADANTAARAALNVQHVLRHDYDLTTDQLSGTLDAPH
jgi:hypothetical protein